MVKTGTAVPTATAVPMGTAIAVPVNNAGTMLQGRRLESAKSASKRIGGIAGIVLTLSSAPSITSGAGILECVTMVWLACFGVLLFLAEWDCMACVKKYFHFLRFRSGRAALAFLSGTFCLAAALDVDTCSQVYYYYGRSAYTLRYLIVAAVLFFAAGYNIRVSQHAREHKEDVAAASGTAMM